MFVIYSSILNHHQSQIADILYEKLGSSFAFVELYKGLDSKGGEDDYSNRPYLIRAWESEVNYSKALQLSTCAEVCVFGGVDSYNLIKKRIRSGRLTFLMTERWLKRGVKNLLSPRLLITYLIYHLCGWRHRKFYCLCCGASVKKDFAYIGMFKNKSYKWGYFTNVSDNLFAGRKSKEFSQDRVRIMWCARFVTWKHPELAVMLAARLRYGGYSFSIDIYGDEGQLAPHDKAYPKIRLENLIKKLEVEDFVSLKGNRPNSDILQAMSESDIFIFTSDKLEGWGAVANESMANGCVLVTSDAIGSTGYLVTHKETGMVFKSGDIDSLYEQVKYLIDNPQERERISNAGRSTMVDLWSPKNAAISLLQLIDDLKEGRDTSIIDGPCSKA